MSDKISPLAPKSYPTLPAIEGVTLATASAGFKYKDRTDVLYVDLSEGTNVSGVFTKSKCSSAPVDWCKSIIGNQKARALIVNSGNANAFTGRKGRKAVEETAQIAAGIANIPTNQIYLASTGVIGEPLDSSLFSDVVTDCLNNLDSSDWMSAAKAIMTTDTFPKLTSRQVELDGFTVTINGIAKGSGMIAPDMATMLSFIFTDAAISPDLAQKILKQVVDVSYNAVTVDGDTSTSDTVLLFSTGKAVSKGATPLHESNKNSIRKFKAALQDLTLDLAHQIVRDGEGATKFVSIEVKNATSKSAAKRIALSIANSPLVKTAISGEDANWGRVVMAIGKAGQPADRDKLSIWFGDNRVAKDGERDPDYSEEAVSSYMRHDEIELTVDLAIGNSKAKVWTCDFSHDYISINADYRS